MLGFKPGAAGREAIMLALFYLARQGLLDPDNSIIISVDKLVWTSKLSSTVQFASTDC